jgi:hypothetical protein
VDSGGWFRLSCGEKKRAIRGQLFVLQAYELPPVVADGLGATHVINTCCEPRKRIEVQYDKTSVSVVIIS